MEVSMRYCGREFSQAEMEIIRGLVHDFPGKSRFFLSKEVCKKLDWRKPDVGLKDMSCRVAMLKMHRTKLIDLPVAKQKYHQGRYKIGRSENTDPEPQLALSIENISDLHLETVYPGNSSRLWNEYIDRYHYLGYTALPGAQIRYFLKNCDKILGLLGFCAAAWKTLPRDRWIGWAAKE